MKRYVALLLLICIGVFTFSGCQGRPSDQQNKGGDVLNEAVSKLFTAPNKELTDAMNQSASVLGEGVPDSSSAKSGSEVDAVVKKQFGGYFTDDELERFTSYYLSEYQLFAADSNVEMKIIESSNMQIKDGYSFKAEVQYGSSKELAEITGDAQINGDGKISSFRIYSDGGLMKSLQGNTK